jgi:hypothetical protein
MLYIWKERIIQKQGVVRVVKLWFCYLNITIRFEIKTFMSSMVKFGLILAMLSFNNAMASYKFDLYNSIYSVAMIFVSNEILKLSSF